MERVIKVAIAEDHEMVRKGVIGFINGFGGFSVDIEACNGKDLYDQLSEAEILPDIVVLDISMPVWDGYEALNAIKKKWPEIKVLILTMHKHEFGIIKMFRSGASGYLLKNAPPKELHKALRSILDLGLYFSEVASSNLYSRLLNANILLELTEKEIQTLRLLPMNMTYKQMADKIGVSEASVRGYKDGLFEKFDVNSRAALVVCAIQMGLASVD